MEPSHLLAWLGHRSAYRLMGGFMRESTEHIQADQTIPHACWEGPGGYNCLPVHKGVSELWLVVWPASLGSKVGPALCQAL